MTKAPESHDIFFFINKVGREDNYRTLPAPHRSSTTDGDDDSDQSTPMVIDSEAVEERESDERRIEERDGFSVTRKENEGSVEEAKV
ncbi:hypothetical protein OIU77_013277 [Salix suchowensis]|uniref:Uncharacterized protein n=1 Tax=Salix suchowensis TaxID=1278906 RepID=A0ABQ8ZUY2_9ROSI|nr:hypothetical protein OIU77_013277 [Salix suchowensis]